MRRKEVNVEKQNKEIASRVYPKLGFGDLKEVDEFIKRGVPREGCVQPDRSERWWVDSTPFDNLTKAREHVINELEIPITDDIRTEFDYEPARGWKKKTLTKGTDMARTPTQTVETIQANLNRATKELKVLTDRDTSNFDETGLTEHKADVKRARDRVYYFTSTLGKAKGTSPARAVTADKKADTLAAMQPNKEYIAPQEMADMIGDIQRDPFPGGRHLPMIQNAFEVSIQTTSGSIMSIKCADERSLDSVFSMVKKHGL